MLPTYNIGNINNSKEEAITMANKRKNGWSTSDFKQIYIMLVDYDYTFRQVADVIKISRSKLHTIVHSKEFKGFCRLYQDSFDYDVLLEILDRRFKTKYIKGGQATKEKYARLRKEKWDDMKKRREVE